MLTNNTQLLFFIEPMPGNESFTLNKYLFLTNSRLSQNGFILLYQDILNILNPDPRKGINIDKRNSFVEFKMFSKYLY